MKKCEQCGREKCVFQIVREIEEPVCEHEGKMTRRQVLIEIMDRWERTVEALPELRTERDAALTWLESTYEMSELESDTPDPVWDERRWARFQSGTEGGKS